MTEQLTRRQIFKVVGSAGAAAALSEHAAAQPARTSPVTAQPPAPAIEDHAPDSVYLFFNAEEAEFVRAAVDLLIPPDEQWAGAGEAGVTEYIDRQLAGAWGAGARLYLNGPWETGTPEQGYQLPYTPAELYRNAITALQAHLDGQFGGRRFHQLDTSERTNLLQDLEKGRLDLGDVPGAVFFETLLANTIEGFFADPAYGGNRDMVGWRMVGFPGAYAAYYEMVELHGRQFDRPPISMAQSAHDHGHHNAQLSDRR